MKEIKWKKMKIESDTGVNAQWDSKDFIITKFIDFSFGKKTSEFTIIEKKSDKEIGVSKTLSNAKDLAYFHAM